jgi:hypothetical protein
MIADVERWSLRIHGRDSDRHRWVMATAHAIEQQRELPPFPGRTFSGVAERRVEVIRRLLAS